MAAPSMKTWLVCLALIGLLLINHVDAQVQNTKGAPAKKGAAAVTGQKGNAGPGKAASTKDSKGGKPKSGKKQEPVVNLPKEMQVGSGQSASKSSPGRKTGAGKK